MKTYIIYNGNGINEDGSLSSGFSIATWIAFFIPQK